jgi:hypothetical protein
MSADAGEQHDVQMGYEVRRIPINCKLLINVWFTI